MTMAPLYKVKGQKPSKAERMRTQCSPPRHFVTLGMERVQRSKQGAYNPCCFPSAYYFAAVRMSKFVSQVLTREGVLGRIVNREKQVSDQHT